MGNNPISDDLLKAFEYFMNTTPPERLSRIVREMFMDYLIHHHEMLPVDFENWVMDLTHLFDLLEKVSAEINETL